MEPRVGHSLGGTGLQQSQSESSMRFSRKILEGKWTLTFLKGQKSIFPMHGESLLDNEANTEKQNQEMERERGTEC